MTHCRYCTQQALPQTTYCLDCIVATRERLRCPDCDSHVTILVTPTTLVIDIAHDPTCPSWHAKQAVRAAESGYDR
jgi:hypothetical protein